MSEKLSLAIENDALGGPSHDLRTLEQPPFEPKQFVRIKSSGTILNVARCEKRVVHGALRWIVDDLNGSRAFAADCELVPTETPPVRYACTKLAAVGDKVKVIGSNPPLHMNVEEISPTGGLYIKSPTGAWCMLLNSSQVEFVPEVTPAHPVCRGCNQPLKAENAWMSDGCPCNNPRGINHGLVPKEVCTCEECAKPDHIVDANKMIEPATDFDFDEAANKAAAFLKGSIDSDSITVCAEWISEVISAQIRPGVQALYAKLQHRRCDTCGANTIDGCVRCGAPQCCPQCCKIDDLERRLNSEDVAHTNTIDHRDTHEASINAICAALGMEEHDASWTSHNNPPDRAIEYIEALRKEAEQLAVAKLLLAQCDNRLFLVGDYELRKTAGGWNLYYPTVGALLADAKNVKVFSNPVQAALRAMELAAVKGGDA